MMTPMTRMTRVTANSRRRSATRLALTALTTSGLLAGLPMAAAVADGPGTGASGSSAALPTGPRSFTPTGTTINGTPSKIGAPEITLGRYVDDMPKTGTKHYLLKLPAGSNPLISATLAMPGRATDDPVFENVEVRVSTPAGTCDRASSRSRSQRGAPMPVTAVATFNDLSTSGGVPRYECGRYPEFYDVQIERDEPDSQLASVPMELSVRLEPPVTGVTALRPPALPLPADPSASRVTSQGARVTGGGTFSNAPLLTPGTYTDVLTPGDITHVKVPVNWGQRLNVTTVVALPELGTDASGEPEKRETVTVEQRLYNPLGQEIDSNGDGSGDYEREYIAGFSGTEQTLHSFTPPVQYRNREARSLEVVAQAAYAGEHVLQIRMEDVGASGNRSQEWPVTFVIEVLGATEGTPSYAPLPGSFTGTVDPGPVDPGTVDPSTVDPGTVPVVPTTPDNDPLPDPDPTGQPTGEPTDEPADPTPTPEGSADPDAEPSSTDDEPVELTNTASEGDDSNTLLYAGGGLAAALLAAGLFLAPWLRRTLTSQSPPEA